MNATQEETDLEAEILELNEILLRKKIKLHYLKHNRITKEETNESANAQE